VARTRVSTSTPAHRGVAVIAAALCLLLAWQLSERRADERTLRAANEAGAAGDYPRALRLARSLTDGTTAADARFVEAQVQLRRGNLRAARRALERSLRARPNDWRARRDYASVLLVLGERRLARRQYARSRSLNPRQPPNRLFDG